MQDELLIRKPYNATTEFVDGAIKHGFGENKAFIDPYHSLTYHELQLRTCQLADGLIKLGIRQEERVALLLQDTIEFPIAFWGCIRAGIIALPLNTFLTEKQYAYILSDSRATGLVIAASLVKGVLPILKNLPSLKKIIIVNSNQENIPEAYDFEKLLAASESKVFAAPTLSDEVAFWMYTSGTTGEPKAVKHVHTTLMSAARLMGQEVLNIKEEDVIFSAAKLFFSYGLGSAVGCPMLVGATTILLPATITAEKVLEIFSKYQPTVFFGVPALYAKLLTHEKRIGTSCLRIAVSAGEALPKELGMRWKEMTGVDVLDGLGSTEMFHTFVSNKINDVCYGTMGKAVPGYDLKIVNEKGNIIARGKTGELLVRGPTAGDGYWNHRLKSKQTFLGEWTRTGDCCFQDVEGYYHYVGRVDDIFKVNGLWVSPSEIESALTSHEAIKEAAVVGKLDENSLIKPKAFVVLYEGYFLDASLQEELKCHVKRHIGSWKYPRWIEACQTLPRTATGKIRRVDLF